MDIGYKYGDSKDFEQCKKVLYNLEEIKNLYQKIIGYFLLKVKKMWKH